jgi:hypothetical protein
LAVLREHATQGEKIMKEAGQDQNESMKAVIRAAHERANFDRVTQMLRNEFREGLQRTGRYSDEELNQIVQDIVRVGNEARHDALIERIEWSTRPVSDITNIPIMNVSSIREGKNFWESLLMRWKDGHIFFSILPLSTLAAQAEKGCAQALLARLESLRGTDD